MHITPSLMGAEDSYCWYGTNSGIYYVKSGYLALNDMHEHSLLDPSLAVAMDWYKSLWSVTRTSKLKLFLWKMLRGALSLVPTSLFES